MCVGHQPTAGDIEKEKEEMSKGRFGKHGGQFVPETLMSAVIELEEAYDKYSKDPQFISELNDLLAN